MKNNINNKVIIITGGSRGIGRALVIEFVKLGASVFFTYKNNTKAAEETIQLSKNYNNIAQGAKICVTDFMGMSGLFRTIKKHKGKIDILINNAAIFKLGRIGFSRPSEWDEMIKVNLLGVINCCHIISKIMISQKSGYIINISSSAAYENYEGQVVYNATKAAVNTVTSSLSCELNRFGINVFGIAPSLVYTDMIRGQKLKKISDHFISPSDVVHSILNVLNQNIHINQGETIRI